MKKIISLALTIVIAFVLTTPVFANSTPSLEEIREIRTIKIISTEIIDAEDGYFEINLYEVQTVDSSVYTTQAAGTYIKIGYRDIIRYNSLGDVSWKYTLSGTYTINEGISVSCTNASYSYSISSGSWKFSNGSSSYSGARAYSTGTFKLYTLLVIVTETVNIDIGMSCDVYGNLYI